MNGFNSALKTFKAATNVPAYKKLLQSKKINPLSIKTEEDFLRLPIVDKKNYIYKNNHQNLFETGTFPPALYASSGSSGNPTYWYRGEAQEKDGTLQHEQIFREIYGIKKTDPTLAIVCFSMGLWVAGGFTYECFRGISRMGYNLTTITPGLEKSDILNTLKNLAPNYKHVVLAGYPPFIMDVLQEAKKQGVKLDAKIKILTAGDKASEDWRQVVCSLVNSKDLYKTVVNIYGCADACMLAQETPFTVFLRRAALKNPKLYKELFGEEKNLPAIFQYNPDFLYFEEQKGELLFTSHMAIPLVRYNIHDLGKLYTFKDAFGLLKQFGLDTEFKKLKLHVNEWPMVIKSGRTDVAVTTYALNIYPEHIRAGLEHKQIAKLVSGNFVAYNKEMDNSSREQLYFDIELSKGIKPSKTLQKQIMDAMVNTLTKVNLEYRKLHESIGQKALPMVKLLQFGAVSPIINQERALLHIKGKKPRMVIK